MNEIQNASAWRLNQDVLAVKQEMNRKNKMNMKRQRRNFLGSGRDSV
jgi:aspartate-semialdehyde dehydrogenase